MLKSTVSLQEAFPEYMLTDEIHVETLKGQLLGRCFRVLEIKEPEPIFFRLFLKDNVVNQMSLIRTKGNAPHSRAFNQLCLGTVVKRKGE